MYYEYLVENFGPQTKAASMEKSALDSEGRFRQFLGFSPRDYMDPGAEKLKSMSAKRLLGNAGKSLATGAVAGPLLGGLMAGSSMDSLLKGRLLEAGQKALLTPALTVAPPIAGLQGAGRNVYELLARAFRR